MVLKSAGTRKVTAAGGLAAVVYLASVALAQTPPAPAEALFQSRCAACHDPNIERAPSRATLALMSPAQISGALETVPFPLATQLRLALWRAAKGDKLKLSLPVEKAGRATLHLVALHRPDGATVRLLLDGSPLVTSSGAEQVRLQSDFAPRVLNVNLKPMTLQEGTRELMIECVDAGVVGLDYLWLKTE